MIAIAKDYPKVQNLNIKCNGKSKALAQNENKYLVVVGPCITDDVYFKYFLNFYSRKNFYWFVGFTEL